MRASGLARIANRLVASYRAGLLQASEQTRFLANVLSESLQDFVETLVDWMRTQYRFDPAEVECLLATTAFRPGKSPWTMASDCNSRAGLIGLIPARQVIQTRPGVSW